MHPENNPFLPTVSMVPEKKGEYEYIDPFKEEETLHDENPFMPKEVR